MVGAYDEYGNQSNSAIGRFQYTGQTWLPEVGLYYYKARLHSPNLGRFMQTDPIGYKDGMNWYAYVGNDPVNAVDSTGMCSSENSNSYLACSLEDKLTNLLTPLIQKALESSGGEVVDDDSSEYEHEPPDNSVLEETVAIVENGVKARNPMKDVKRIIKVHGGGKNDKHANQARREAARLKYEQARAKVAELKARPNKTKQDKEDLKKRKMKWKELEGKRILQEKIIVKSPKGRVDMKKDNLFTFFLEWKQGTYISQIAGDSLDMAIEKWCELNETKQNLGITGDAFKLFRENMTDSNAIKVNGLESVWCGSTVMEGELLLLNIVKTTRERRFD